MNSETTFYIFATIVVVLIFFNILKKVFAELDRANSFKTQDSVEDKNSTLTRLEVIAKQNEQALGFVNELKELFNFYIQEFNNKEKANALFSVLCTFENKDSAEITEKLGELLEEFEEEIRKNLSEEKAIEFKEKAYQKYQEYFQ